MLHYSVDFFQESDEVGQREVVAGITVDNVVLVSPHLFIEDVSLSCQIFTEGSCTNNFQGESGGGVSVDTKSSLHESRLHSVKLFHLFACQSGRQQVQEICSVKVVVVAPLFQFLESLLDGGEICGVQDEIVLDGGSRASSSLEPMLFIREEIQFGPGQFGPEISAPGERTRRFGPRIIRPRTFRPREFDPGLFGPAFGPR
ncbi:unnamed protein product [Cyprideis torosa]|uniref:Uncharacterized protein n=1 Tax=Cyprideis torosa TaxID=163714 RepID=A0A7R8W6U6_9CRUS|nr:unnamed protein product [Cyprideis torosa]CAG0885582.1 unnamed protein product [Cyprideis torosa]